MTSFALEASAVKWPFFRRTWPNYRRISHLFTTVEYGVRKMQTVKQSARGLHLLMELNRDRAFSCAAIAASLGAAAWIGALTV